MEKIKGRIKAAYIYSIMPRRIRSILTRLLSRNELNKITGSIRKLDKISAIHKRRIISEFIEKLQVIKTERKQLIDSSLTVSLVVISILFLSSFIYSYIILRSTDRIIHFIDSILSNGGMHLILFPYVWGVVKSEFRVSPLTLLFSSKNHIIDILYSVPVFLLMSILFVYQPGSHSHTLSGAGYYFSSAVALTIGPAIEEIFFRYYLFNVSGKKYGYLICGIVSSLLFAAVHIPDNLYLFLKYLISGGLLCAICYIRQSVFPSFFAHSTANLIVILL